MRDFPKDYVWEFMCKAGDQIPSGDGDDMMAAATTFQKCSAFFIVIFIIYCMRSTWNECNFAVCSIQLAPQSICSDLSFLVLILLQMISCVLIIGSTWLLFALEYEIQDQLLNCVALVFLLDVDTVVGSILVRVTLHRIIVSS